jgi:acyl-CoA reductase-like NAD-dependent aldehyde dehydrogenase
MSTTETRPTVDADAGVIHVLKPVDGSVLEDVHIDSPGRVAEVAGALRAVQPAWEALTLAERTKWLQRLRDWILDNTDRLVDLMHAEAGKIRFESVLELNWVCDIINIYASKAPKLLADQRVWPTSPLLKVKKFTIQRRPYQLAGVIGPWNFPVVLSLGDGIPALFAGGAVLIKPSEVTPLTLREIVRGWRAEIGAPPVLDAVFGAGETGAALIDESDYVQFTGSVATGHKVAERAARTLTPVGLELGGKDPLIVLAGANIKRAANCAVTGGFGNNGQVCIATERVYVEASIYDEFVEQVVANVKALRMGEEDVEGHAVDLGPMISPTQISIVDSQVRDAVAKGATALTGGRQADRPGDWYEPTVLVGVDRSMKVLTEETFGPVLPIVKVSGEAEAVRLANDSEFGLAASVFAKTVQEGERVARLIDAGTVNVNDYAVGPQCIDVPMGGWKNSGIGARSGDYGFLKYTRAKTVTSPRLPDRESEMWWMPYNSRRQAVVERIFRFNNARDFKRRLGLKK